MLASRAPELHEALATAQENGLPYLTLDGTLVPTDRVAGNGRRRAITCDIRASTKASTANIHVIADPIGFPLSATPVEPGSSHDITVARDHCLGELYPVAATGTPTLADKGYQGVGIGVHTPIKGGNLGADKRAYNAPLAGVRAIGERANALLTQRWTALRHITLSPSRIRAAVTGALVLSTLQRGTR